MLRQSLDQLIHSPLDGIDLISTDVFDTLLLRQPRSQRSRVMQGEQRFARLLREEGFAVSPQHLFRTRQLAERYAYRALNVGGGAGEVRLVDIVARQVALLGLPECMIDRRMALEIAIEKASLCANEPLAKALRLQRQAGIRIVAVSDTALSTPLLAELINHFHGPGLIDAIYSSADAGASKRYGQLFSSVLSEEGVIASRVLHVGDDFIADCTVPQAMGIRTVHLPKGRLRRLAAQADGAWVEAARAVRHHLAPTRQRIPEISDRTAFGKEVFGPIVAQFCLHMWLYATQAQTQGNAALLFCARGGIGIREVFERLLNKLQLPLSIRRENVMISRLVAARAAVARRSRAALDELGREFRKGSFADVANALGGHCYDLSGPWQATFERQRFYAMLDSPEGALVLDDIVRQTELFERHLDVVSSNATRIILCDTGLYGSTQRLVAAGLPQRQFETIQFARCNYKGFSEDHFPQVVGLVVEEDFYNPLKIETVILRYWQIIESLFEPAIPSVRHFHEVEGGGIRSNAGDIAHGRFDPAADNPLLTGVLQYVEQVQNGAQIIGDADHAWVRLKQAITNPGAFDMEALGVGARSVDFGRQESVFVLNQSAAPDLARKLASVKAQLWREGAIARDFPLLKSALLPALELVHIVRGVSARLSR
ncbi:hydrolase [Rhizobiaceae bacterium n13]|uniref:Hydrolase n=1 Tax=Ferirhizobium litorale TaxID=2927786 RepID=A0AAE3QDY0_9HYPH|nr:hydrolase [Fererhizobium litorale]MDI7862979.1 hydrolase [Fererhizobium litorale]MDI7924052.1 hydrolase [Fererhizobium litorale]